MDVRKLIDYALEARKKAYVPYSGFLVGAALMDSNGNVHTGCNIENAAYTPSNCAERTAFFKAISEGHYSFDAIAIVGGKGDEPLDYCAPCGVCRQVMMEFCDPDQFRIILAKSKDVYKEYSLSQLLPIGFGPKNLNPLM